MILKNKILEIKVKREETVQFLSAFLKPVIQFSFESKLMDLLLAFS